MSKYFVFIPFSSKVFCICPTHAKYSLFVPSMPSILHLSHSCQKHSIFVSLISKVFFICQTYSAECFQNKQWCIAGQTCGFPEVKGIMYSLLMGAVKMQVSRFKPEEELLVAESCNPWRAGHFHPP